MAHWENECIWLTVCPLHGHDSIIGLPVADILREFSLADNTRPIRLEPAWQKMAQSLLYDTAQPVDIEEVAYLQPWTDNDGKRWCFNVYF